MKKLFSVLLFLVITAPHAFAGGYASINGGVGIVDDFDIKGNAGKAELSFDTGYGITAALGHNYDNGFRTEVEFGYLESALDEIKVTGISIPVNLDATLTNVMMNFYGDLLPQNTISPFVGGGFGYCRAELDEAGDDNLLAYQFMAGGSYKITESLSSDLQYRYFGTERVEIGYGLKGDTLTTHNFLLGLRYSF